MQVEREVTKLHVEVERALHVNYDKTSRAKSGQKNQIRRTRLPGLLVVVSFHGHPQKKTHTHTHTNKPKHLCVTGSMDLLHLMSKMLMQLWEWISLVLQVLETFECLLDEQNAHAICPFSKELLLRLTTSSKIYHLSSFIQHYTSWYFLIEHYLNNMFCFLCLKFNTSSIIILFFLRI